MDSSCHLSAILSESFIRQLAGDRYYQRGVDYFRRGLVDSLVHSGNILEATVCGTESYAVRLSWDGKKFKFSCECPIGEDGAFCKHCVATGLAALAGQAVASPVETAKSSRRITTKDMEDALCVQDKETIIKWLIEYSGQNEGLRQKLTLMAGLKNGPGALIAQVRRDLEKAIKIRGYRDYDQAPVYAARVASAIESIETVLQQGHATEVLDLCETSMKWLEAAAGNIDDSDGQVTELMEQIAVLHLSACERAKPAPETLAIKLFSLELNAGFNQWGDTVDRYAHVLGDKGMAAFREAAAKAWEKVPTRTVHDSHRGSEGHYSITRIMESLARRSGDVEQLVSVLERDLTSSHQYLRIADSYRQAGLYEKALHWAERGMACYPDREGTSLMLFAAEEYRRADRHADAMRLIWAEFRSSTSLQNYKLLESFARAADDWEDWRARALAYLSRPVAQCSTAESSSLAKILAVSNRTQGRSLLVEIFLYEGNLEDAWREARAGGCRNDLWQQLATQSETTHPADAAIVYLQQGERAVADVSDGRYEKAIQLLERAAALMNSLDRSQEFEMKFEFLRQQFKAKRNLQKLAEARRRFLYLS